MNTSIQAYIHCKSCAELGREDHLAVGASDPQTLVVHCELCDMHVGSFKLAEPFPKMHCAACGEEIGPNHRH
jgi:hypothetical protein